MKLVGAGLSLMVVCVLGGCATYWYQEGKTFDETRYDLAACQAEAMRYSDVGRHRVWAASSGNSCGSAWNRRATGW